MFYGQKLLYLLVIFLLCSVAFVLVTYFLIYGRQRAECRINPYEVSLHPILVYPGDDHFIYPQHGEEHISFRSGQSLEFLCPGRKVVVAESPTNASIQSGTCLTNNIFKIGGHEVEWQDLKCSDAPWRTIKYTGQQCYNNGSELEVGFEVAQGRFLRTMTICFNPLLQIAYYSYINQTASINQRDLNAPRSSFLQGSGFYDIGNVNSLYVRKNQRATINKLLGLMENSTKYVQDTTNYFLSRGHLTAKADQFYGVQQNATFFYQNAAPQWYSFNLFNWRQIEKDVRDYAESRAVDLQVWTGIHGILKLPQEETGELTELYLFVNETSGRRALPVPEIYWKVVYNPVSKLGVALIGVNNPFETTLSTICYDVSMKLSWLRWKKDSQEKGFCYACSVETFRRVVTSMPHLEVKGLLL